MQRCTPPTTNATTTIRIFASAHHPPSLRMYLLSPEYQHVLDLTHDAFAAIKSEQGILVDFAGFPTKMIDLLERCLNNNNPVSPRFQAVLQGDVFQVVEVNDFKHVPHIRLELVRSSDACCKQLLTFRLDEVQQQCATACENAAALQKELQACTAALAQTREEAAAKMHEAVQAHTTAMQTMQDRFEEQRVQMQRALTEALEAQTELDNRVRDLTQRLVAAEAQRDAAIVDAASLRESLQRQAAAQELLASQLREAGEKREAAAVLQALADRQASQLAALEARCQSMQTATQQHTIDVQASQQALQTALDGARDEGKALQARVAELTGRAEVAEAAQQMAEQVAERAEKQVKEAQGMIEWLNQQMNESWALHHRSGVGFGGLSSSRVKKDSSEKNKTEQLVGVQQCTPPALRSKVGRMLAGQLP